MEATGYARVIEVLNLYLFFNKNTLILSNHNVFRRHLSSFLPYFTTTSVQWASLETNLFAKGCQICLKNRISDILCLARHSRPRSSYLFEQQLWQAIDWCVSGAWKMFKIQCRVSQIQWKKNFANGLLSKKFLQKISRRFWENKFSTMDFPNCQCFWDSRLVQIIFTRKTTI